MLQEEEDSSSQEQAIISGSREENDLLGSYTDIEVSISSDGVQSKIRLPLAENQRCSSDPSEFTDDREYFSIGEQSNPYAAKGNKKTGIYEVEEVSNESDHDESSDSGLPKTPARFSPTSEHQPTAAVAASMQQSATTGTNEVVPVVKPADQEILPSEGDERMPTQEIVDYNLETEHNDPIELTEEDADQMGPQTAGTEIQCMVSDVQARYNEIQ